MAEIYRYKLVLEVLFEGSTSNFVFWNREYEDLLGISAGALRQTMIDAKITDPLDYPLVLDDITARTMVVFKVKWQPKWDSCSVQALKEDNDLVEKIKSKLAAREEESKKSIHAGDAKGKGGVQLIRSPCQMQQIKRKKLYLSLKLYHLHQSMIQINHCQLLHLLNGLPLLQQIKMKGLRLMSQPNYLQQS